MIKLHGPHGVPWESEFESGARSAVRAPRFIPLLSAPLLPLNCALRRPSKVTPSICLCDFYRVPRRFWEPPFPLASSLVCLATRRGGEGECES